MDVDLSRLVDALPGLIWTALPDGSADFVNLQWSEYAGMSREQAAGSGWLSAIHPEDRARVIAQWGSFVEAGQSGQVEARLRRADGIYRWFNFRVAPLADATGKVVKWCGINTDIDDRKRAEERRAEEALLDGERYARWIMDTIPGMIALMKPTGEVEAVNSKVLEYFGRSREELQKWGTSDAVHPEDLPRVYQAATLAFAAGQPYEIEHRIRGADGVYRWHQITGLPLRDSTGQVARYCCLITNIEDRKRIEETLLARERNLNTIINTLPTTAWSTRPDGYCDFLSDRWLDYAGYTAKEAEGWGWAKVIHADDAPGLAAYWQKCLLSGTPVDAEARMRRHDGEYRWFLFLANPLRDKDGTIIKWYGTNVDIDDRKHFEEDLRRRTAQLVDAEVLSKTGSVEFDFYHDVHSWSDETYKIFEVEYGTTITKARFLERFHPDDISVISEFIARSETISKVEFRLLMPDGRLKYVRAIGYITSRIEGLPVGTASIQDITEQRLSEQALDKVRSELAHLARVSSLGALTASIAHEVNQPLSGIITNASTCLRMLVADPPNIEGARETARRIIRDGNRAAEVIARLRALFAGKASRNDAVDLCEATREVIALSANDLQRGHVILQAELAEGLPAVSGDRVQLQQVVLNLLMNAIDAMSGVEDRPRQIIVRNGLDDEGRVRVAVQDSGVGLGAQAAEWPFQAFHTTKPNGMGIGLSISRSIIESHGGRLWAERNEGPGATFAFSVPACNGCAPGDA